MDAAKARKLEEYAIVIEKQAQAAESQGNTSEASSLYIKLVDIYLLLANDAADHTTWTKYITRAQDLQKKVKDMNAPGGASQPAAKTNNGGGIKKIFGIKSSQDEKKPLEQRQAALPQAQSTPQVKPQLPPPLSLAPQREPEQVIPKRLYDQLLEKTKQLESRAASMVDRSDYEELESRYRDLEEKISSSPSKQEFEEQKRRLEQSVPRVQYEELQKALVNLIPKDTFNAAQARISELESQLENSIPASILENLANEISLLSVTASIPIIHPTDDTQNVSHETRQEAVSEELSMMRQRLDMLELKLKSSTRA